MRFDALPGLYDTTVARLSVSNAVIIIMHIVDSEMARACAPRMNPRMPRSVTRSFIVERTVAPLMPCTYQK